MRRTAVLNTACTVTNPPGPLGCQQERGRRDPRTAFVHGAFRRTTVEVTSPIERPNRGLCSVFPLARFLL